MARRNIVIPDELDERLRRALAAKPGGMTKGDYSEAICEAIEQWLDREEVPRQKREEQEE